LNKLLEYIHSVLSAIHSKSFFEEAPEIDPDTQKQLLPPYIVFHTPTDNDTEGRDEIILEIDFWGSSNDVPGLEIMVDSIETRLNSLLYIGSGFYVRFTRLSRLAIPEPEKEYKHRQLRYLAATQFFR
jgi:hypothetical protein